MTSQELIKKINLKIRSYGIPIHLCFRESYGSHTILSNQVGEELESICHRGPITEGLQGRAEMWLDLNPSSSSRHTRTEDSDKAIQSLIRHYTGDK